MSLDGMMEEILYQLEELPRLALELEELRGEKARPELCLFVGTGDSFAASLAAHYLSHHKAGVADPYELLRCPDQARGRLVFFVSVSGRPRENIAASKAIAGLAAKRIAITANPEGELAKTCDEVLHLTFKRHQRITAGTIGFTASLLACCSIFRKVQPPKGLMEAHERGLRMASEIELPSNGTTYWIGEGLGYALALYGAAKTSEVLGYKANYERLEQFCHAPLFSLKPEDLIVILGDVEKAQDLERGLLKSGQRALRLGEGLAGEMALEGALRLAIMIQLLCHKNAIRRGMREVAFLANEELLGLSSSLIY